MTIKEIAEAAGVSRGTVDRVLHNRGGVRPDIEKRVRTIAKAMGYTPNRAGRILAARKQPLNIGCFLPGVGNAFFDDILKGLQKAERELSDFGVSLLTKSIRGYDTFDHIQAIQELVDSGCNALCLCTIDTPPIRHYVNQLADYDIPIMTFNTDLTGTKRLCYVGSDYTRSGNTAAGLFSMFHKTDIHLLIITGSFRIKGHNDRIAGFTKTLKEHHIPYHLVDVLESQDDDDISYATVQACLKKHPQTNCFYITAAGVEGACRAIEEHRRTRPNEKRWVMTFDDIEPTRRLIRSGAIDFTIDQAPIEQGYQVVQKMFNYVLNGRKKAPRDFILTELIKIKENL